MYFSQRECTPFDEAAQWALFQERSFRWSSAIRVQPVAHADRESRGRRRRQAVRKRWCAVYLETKWQPITTAGRTLPEFGHVRQCDGIAPCRGDSLYLRP